MKKMKFEKNEKLINLLNPVKDSVVLVYDVHASESGAKAILDDFYSQVSNYGDESIRWVFITSVLKYPETDNIVNTSFPWVKKNWIYRLIFEKITTRKILKKYNPDIVFSLQNNGIKYFKKKQYVYLHLPFILTDHKFTIRKDGKKLWIYQNILSKMIFKSLKKVNRIIVQTEWMKKALIEKARISEEKIIINYPDISTNNIRQFTDNKNNRSRIFYPATSFSYKNHITLLKAIKYLSDIGLKEYEVIFTLRGNENKYTKFLKNYIEKYSLNVKMIGQVSREEVFNLYSTSILVFPSYVESFGMPLLEARISNTYVVASDCPFSREILDGYNKSSFFYEMDYKKCGDEILKIINK